MDKKANDFLLLVDKLYLDKAINDNKKYLEEHESGGKFMPSFISTSNCLRAWYYSYIGKLPSDDCYVSRFIRIMNNGSNFHTRIQKLLVGSGVVKNDNVECKIWSEEWKISGHVDAIIESKDGKSYVLEFKSINSRDYEKVLKFGPLPSHIMQSSIYVWLLQKENNKNIGGSIIYYENKDNQDHIAFFFPDYDKEIINKLQDNINAVLSYCEAGNLPNIAYNALCAECQYCRWKSACQVDGGSARASVFKIK